jgi:hypothetical protein
VGPIAKNLLRTINQGTPLPNQIFTQSSLALYLKGELQSNLDLDFLYSEIYGLKTKAKWMKYHAIPEHLIHQGINWEAVEIAMKQEPQDKRRFITKFCAKQLAMGRALSRRHHQPHDRCPRCDAENEDAYHILKCQSTSAYSTWTDAVDALDDWMSNEDTDSSLRQAILQRLWLLGAVGTQQFLSPAHPIYRRQLEPRTSWDGTTCCWEESPPI